MENIMQFSMTKYDHIYVFRYERGKEYELLDAMARMADDRRLSFGWSDAVFISYQTGYIKVFY